MSVYELDPVRDPRWTAFVQQSSRASVFHTTDWLRALERTYEYVPVVYTTSAPGSQLQNGWVFCRIRSWLTGCRLVSLPFSDHCDPLVDNPGDFEELFKALYHECTTHRWGYVESRPLRAELDVGDFERSCTFCVHRLNLNQDIDELFHAFHKDSTQRKIRRAERERLTFEEGRSEVLLDQFYRLIVLTRRRHQLPPQPRKWFSNLIRCMGDQLIIRVASHQKVPVAGILTLRFKNSLTYKYGCADKRCFRLGAMQMLLWRAIKEAKESGLKVLDLGRSEWSNKGLITFKDRLGAIRVPISYFRYPAGVRQSSYGKHVKGILSALPDWLFINIGTLLYKHFS